MFFAWVGNNVLCALQLVWLRYGAGVNVEDVPREDLTQFLKVSLTFPYARCDKSPERKSELTTGHARPDCSDIPHYPDGGAVRHILCPALHLATLRPHIFPGRVAPNDLLVGDPGGDLAQPALHGVTHSRDDAAMRAIPPSVG